MGGLVTEAWRDDTGVVVGSFIRVHVVTVIVAIIQVRITMVGIRLPPCMREVEVMGNECELTGCE